MKMRTLSNYCLDLRFQRPRVEQIKGAMMSLAFKEGLKIPPAALNEIILASNHDIRQVGWNCVKFWKAWRGWDRPAIHSDFICMIQTFFLKLSEIQMI